MPRQTLLFSHYLWYLSLALSLSACELESNSADYPYLLAAPQVTALANGSDPTRYDLTVTLQASGPNPIHSVSVTIDSLNGELASPPPVELVQYVPDGHPDSWSATAALPLRKGLYRIASIALHDGDPAQGGTVKSTLYLYQASDTDNSYTILNREAIYTTDPGNPTDFTITHPGSSDFEVVEFDPSQL